MFVAASDSNAGLLLRTLIPTLFIVPIILGWLRLLGERVKLYGTPFGTSLLVLANIVCLTTLILWVSRSLFRFEREREAAKEALKGSEKRLAGIIASAMDAIIAIDEEQRIVLFNKAAEKMFGCSASDALRSTIDRFIPERFSTEHNAHIIRGDSGIINRVMGTLWAVRTNGDEFPIEASISHTEADETPLFTAIIRDISERRRAEQAVRESEARFALVANTAPVMIWMTGPDKLCTYLNQFWLQFTGRSLESQLGNGWTEGVHPDDVDQCLATYAKAFDRREPFYVEFRVRRHDGEYRWILGRGVPRFNTDGSFAGYIGSAADVTEHKEAEEALSSVNRRLIEAQEEERSWIARELHDDVNQRLALLAISLDRLEQSLPGGSTEVRQDVGKASLEVRGLASDLQALSHRLHSSKLEYMGLIEAAIGLCGEVSDQHGVETDFHTENVPGELPREVSLCLFRVLQEALQNAIKHSGSRDFQVSLIGGPNQIDLSVHDSGSGFDAREAMRGRGLGLTSMRERLKLVHGELSIESQPGKGTTVHARVPVSPKMMVASATG